MWFVLTDVRERYRKTSTNIHGHVGLARSHTVSKREVPVHGEVRLVGKQTFALPRIQRMPQPLCRLSHLSHAKAW